jgi:nucleotide-binding universal stress UspA family protein
MTHVLVPLDGSPLAEATLPLVEDLARRTDGHVTLLYVAPVPHGLPPVPDPPAIDELVRRDAHLAEAYLDEHRRRLTAAGIDAAATIAAGRPAVQILRQAEASGVDLIALATHGRSGLQAWTHGSVTEEVLHTTRTPLLLVRPGDHWPAAPHGLARVLVPLDGSEEAERALAVAEPLAARGLRLVLLRCVEPLSLGFLDPSGVPPPGMQPVLGMLLREAREYVADVAARLRARGLAVTTEVVVAAASDGVTAAARSAPGTIVVLASHARSGWRRFLLGSVARRVARLLPTPVVVCPAPHGAPRALAAAPGVSPIAGPGP